MRPSRESKVESRAPVTPGQTGRARHSVRAGLGQTDDGAHGVTRPTYRRLAFSLIEVMVAIAIFFMCTFAILGLTSQLLQNARSFQTKKAPHVSLVHAWWTSKTNRVIEGLTTVEFSEISDDLGQLYRDYYAEVDAQPDQDMTNGLWDVTYQVFNRRTRQVESKVFTLYWDPNSQSKQAGGGLR